MERTGDQRTILRAVAERFRGRWPAAACLHKGPRRRAHRGSFRQTEEGDGVRPRLVGTGAVRRLPRVWRRGEVAFPRNRTAMAQRRAVPGRPSSLQRRLYSVYRRDDGLGADGAEGPRILTSVPRARTPA